MNTMRTPIRIQKNRLGFLSFAAFSIFLSACGSGPDKKGSNVNIAGKSKSDTIELSMVQIKTASIQVGIPEQKNLTDLIKVNGQLMVPPESKAEVNSLIGGKVTNVLIKEGDYVRKGQVLAYIENPEFIRMQQGYLTTKSNLVYVTQEFERQKRLSEQNAGTGKVFQQAQSTYLTEKAKLNALAKQLQQIHISVNSLDNGNIKTQIPLLSPISGQVFRILVNIGSSADMNKTLMEIIDDSAVYCDLKIFQKNLDKIQVGQKITFQISEQTEKAYSGKITSINSTYEAENRIVIAHATVNHQSNGKLIPGSYVSASILLGDKTVLAVPADALVSADGKSFVFRVIPESGSSQPDEKNTQQEMRFIKTEVIRGISDQQFTEIKLLKPLPKNTQIVTEGARYVLAQSQGGQSDDE